MRPFVHLFLIFILLGIQAGMALAADSQIEKFCRSEWPKDHQKRHTCIQQQKNAEQRYQGILHRLSALESIEEAYLRSALVIAVDSCSRKWANPSHETFDYPKMVVCIEENSRNGAGVNKQAHQTTGVYEFCQRKFPDNIKSKKECVRNQRLASIELSQIAESRGLLKDGKMMMSPYGSPVEKTFHQCMIRNRQDNGLLYDYVSVILCLRNQLASMGGTTD